MGKELAVKATVKLKRHRFSAGFALPLALTMLFLIGFISAVYMRLSSAVLTDESLLNTHELVKNSSEGVLHHFLAHASSSPQEWNNAIPLADLPQGYSLYDPNDYGGTNGLPSCSYSGCERSLAPYGGGIVKNFGSAGSWGQLVDTTRSVTAQLTPDSPRTPDVTIGKVKGWYLVERLKEILSPENRLYTETTNNPEDAVAPVHFRVTTHARTSLKGQEISEEVVAIIEVPPR